MKIKNLNEPIIDMDGKPIGTATADVNQIIAILAGGKPQDQLLHELMSLRDQSSDPVTYVKVYETAVLGEIKDANASQLMDAMDIANKLRRAKDGDSIDFTIEEIKTIKDRIVPTMYVTIVKGRALKNLEDAGE